MARIFVYDGRNFPDPGPGMSVDEVRRHLADFFPELANADTREEKRGEDTVHTFTRRIGTKGVEMTDVELRVTLGFYQRLHALLFDVREDLARRRIDAAFVTSTAEYMRQLKAEIEAIEKRLEQPAHD